MQKPKFFHAFATALGFLVPAAVARNATPGKTLRIVLIALGASLFMSGCGSPSDKFVGKWQNAKHKNDVMEIRKNGEGFLITDSKDVKIAATLQNGALVVPFGQASISFTYIKDSDTLLMNSPMQLIDSDFEGTYKRY